MSLCSYCCVSFSHWKATFSPSSLIRKRRSLRNIWKSCSPNFSSYWWNLPEVLKVCDKVVIFHFYCFYVTPSLHSFFRSLSLFFPPSLPLFLLSSFYSFFRFPFPCLPIIIIMDPWIRCVMPTIIPVSFSVNQLGKDCVVASTAYQTPCCMQG